MFTAAGMRQKALAARVVNPTIKAEAEAAIRSEAEEGGMSVCLPTGHMNEWAKKALTEYLTSRNFKVEYQDQRTGDPNTLMVSW